MCACGRPLHYTDPKIRYYVEKMVAELGPEVTISIAGFGAWKVPRHFIALHQIIGHQLPALARRYGFKPVKE